MNIHKKLFQIIKIASIVSLLFLVACSTTHQARSVTTSGFLGDYSQLKAGNGDEALLRYVRPGVDLSKYDQIIIEPIQIYAGKKSKLGETSYEERQALSSYFSAALHTELSKDYKLVSKVAPNVLIIRAAITDADSSMVMLNSLTTIMPIGLAVSSLKRAVSGSDSFVGEAQCELEIVDAFTEQRLGAFVDKRIGTKALRSKFGSWNDAKEAFDYWAERVRVKLEEARKSSE